MVPALELSINPGLDTTQKYFEFNWTMTEFNTTYLMLHLNFAYPELISKTKYKLKDYLAVKINGNDLF